jgi:very-short-patch-repair endonuclease
VRQIAREMRSSMTPAEVLLWSKLRNKQLAGLRFRAQHPVGRFVLDFCCTSLRLVIELDGSAHIGREQDDLARSQHLEAYGYTVIRFTNDEIMNDLDSVIQAIKEAALTQPPFHSGQSAST